MAALAPFSLFSSILYYIILYYNLTFQMILKTVELIYVQYTELFINLSRCNSFRQVVNPMQSPGPWISHWKPVVGQINYYY